MNEIDDLKSEDFFTTTKLDSTSNSEHKLYVHFTKTKATWNDFYHVLKKHHLLTSLKVFLTKKFICSFLFYFSYDE